MIRNRTPSVAQELIKHWAFETRSQPKAAVMARRTSSDIGQGESIMQRDEQFEHAKKGCVNTKLKRKTRNVDEHFKLCRGRLLLGWEMLLAVHVFQFCLPNQPLRLRIYVTHTYMEQAILRAGAVNFDRVLRRTPLPRTRHRALMIM